MYRLIIQVDNGTVCIDCATLEELYPEMEYYRSLKGVRSVEASKMAWVPITFEPSSYSCRACKSYSQERIRKLEEALKKYADPEHHISVVDGKAWEVFDNGYGVDEQEFGTWAKGVLNDQG